MTRLFVSLYALIVCGLLTINFISERVWKSVVEKNTQDFYQTQQVIESLPQLISLSTQSNSFQNTANVPLSVHDLNDFFWLDEQITLLNAGKSVVMFNELENPIFYIKIPNENKVYQFGPFIQQQGSQSLAVYKWIILSVSYLLLAAIIAIWLKPLWRDLSQLNSMALSISDGNLDISPNVTTQSPINHVVVTFHHMSRRIKRLLEDQKHLVNAVSHELRTPLSRLRFALAVAPNKNDQATKDMESDIKEIENLVDEMLGYARLENVNQSIEFTQVNLTEIVASQISKLTDSSLVHVNADIHQQHFLICNQKLIERALQNLLTNAMRYANSQVLVSIVEGKSTLNISVQDDGAGIEEHELKHVFEPFYRANESSGKTNSGSVINTNTSSSGGFGLGLAIVRRICDWHRGKCWVEKSELGGCKFVLSFPLKK